MGRFGPGPARLSALLPRMPPQRCCPCKASQADPALCCPLVAAQPPLPQMEGGKHWERSRGEIEALVAAGGPLPPDLQEVVDRR